MSMSSTWRIDGKFVKIVYKRQLPKKEDGSSFLKPLWQLTSILEVTRISRKANDKPTNP